MIEKYVEEAIKRCGLSQEGVKDMLIDFVESLIDNGRLIDEDVETFFEEALTEEVKKIVRLDADTKEIVKFLFDKGIFVKRPVEIKFEISEGFEWAILDLEQDRSIPRAVKVRRHLGGFTYFIINKKFPVNAG